MYRAALNLLYVMLNLLCITLNLLYVALNVLYVTLAVLYVTIHVSYVTLTVLYVTSRYETGRDYISDILMREEEHWLDGAIKKLNVADKVISHNVSIKWFWKVNSPTKSSTYCLLSLQVDHFVGELTF